MPNLFCHAEFISASPCCTNPTDPEHRPTDSFRMTKYDMKRTYHSYHVYILTNKRHGTLYIGVTGGLDDRMERHRKGKGSKFAGKYNLTKLVYFEEFQYVEEAIAREKQLKNWHRTWKINLIEEVNPEWEDLYKPLDRSDLSS